MLNPKPQAAVLQRQLHYRPQAAVLQRQLYQPQAAEDLQRQLHYQPQAAVLQRQLFTSHKQQCQQFFYRDYYGHSNFVFGLQSNSNNSRPIILRRCCRHFFGKRIMLVCLSFTNAFYYSLTLEAQKHLQAIEFCHDI